VRRCSSGDGPRRTRSRDWITHAGMRARAEMAHGRRLVLTRGLALAGDLGRRCGLWVTAVENLECYRAAVHTTGFSPKLIRV
jgi:hypothetical protein